uniref:Secreted protein n=1 Tax=Ixodes ricinus TaxID=34613 RepID=A0A147BAJ8_IXORI
MTSEPLVFSSILACIRLICSGVKCPFQSPTTPLRMNCMDEGLPSSSRSMLRTLCGTSCGFSLTSFCTCSGCMSTVCFMYAMLLLSRTCFRMSGSSSSIFAYSSPRKRAILSTMPRVSFFRSSKVVKKTFGSFR